MRWGRLVLLSVGLLLGAAILVFGPAIGLESLWLRVLIAVVLLLPVPILFLLDLLQRRSTKAALTRRVQPSLPFEVRAALEAKLSRWTQVLDASKLAGEPLARLPRVLVIGPSGSGKSSAIHRAKLQLRFTTSPEGGTDAMEIALSPRGTLFDLPGRFLSDDGVDHATWLALLGMLAPKKKPVPIDGILAVIALDELLAAPTDDREALALLLRRRLHEAFDALGWCMPVYLLFSKCDRLFGFVESFAVLESAKRAQPLGFLMEKDQPEELHAELERLVAHQRAAAHARLSQLEPPLRAGTYAFPEQLAGSAPILESFLRRLYEPSPEGDRTSLGGVYFASAAQDRATSDRAGLRIREAFAIGGRPQIPAADGARSFFLHELFERVVLPGVRPASRSARGRRRFQIGTAGGLAVMLVASLAILGGALISYRRNTAMIASTVALTRGLARPDSDLSPSDYDRLTPIAPVADRLEELEGWEQDRPLFSRFGFYSGSELLVPLRRAFERPMQELFVDRVGIELESMLGDPTGSGDVATDYDVLKAYLMLTLERDRIDPAFVAPVLVDVWKRRLDTTAASETELLQKLATLFVREVARGAAKWPTASVTLIGDARAGLRRRSAEYERMVAGARRAAGRPMTLTEIVGGKVPDALRAGRDVDRLYTLDGWKKVRFSFEESPEGAEAWVLGEHATNEAMVAKAREQYLEQFSAEWQRFLRELSIREARSLPDARGVLEELTAKPSVLELLLRGIKEQMKFPSAADEALAAGGLLKGKAGALAKHAAAKAPNEKNRVQQEFAPLFELVDPAPDAAGNKPTPALAELLDRLAAVKGAIEKLDQSEDADTKAVQAAVAEAKSAVDTVFRTVPPAIGKLASPLFLDALRGVTAEAETERFERTNKAFAERVCALFHETLANRFPFAPKAEDDALPDSVLAMFSPAGMAWTFFDTALQQDLIKVGDSVEAKPKARVSREVVAFYRKAALIRAALFPGNAAALDREFQVRPQGIITAPDAAVHVTGVTLEIGGEKRTYKFGPPETWSFPWPPKVGRARLSLEGISEPIETWGDWALLRLAERAAIKPLAGGWVELRFSFKQGQVQVPLHFRTSGTTNPLIEYQRFPLSCPR